MCFAKFHLLIIVSALAVPGSLLYAQAGGTASAPADNGIHVGAPKVYDSRELTLMLDSLSESLQNKQFVDPAALAKSLGNTQGYQSTDFSQSAYASGAAGPQAAAAGTLGAASSSPGTSTTSGPQAPALPALQTPPAYAPTFGANGSDTLSDEVNLTYQLYNVRMLLSRSLTDRLHREDSRLQAVVGFDIDIEQDKRIQDAAAIVEVTPAMEAASEGCEDATPGVIALMPEEGSHNAATLSQKANAFGGAITSNVFSVGYSAQKRSQVFYLYRDMDTLSFQKLASTGSLEHFGWQFRPVLGKRSVDPGLRHMIVVLSLPCSDVGDIRPKISLSVRTRWVRYESKTQTTIAAKHFWQAPMPADVPTTFTEVEAPSTHSFQERLKPKVSTVSWFPADDNSGIAVVEGDNFFPGTMVRLGTKILRSSADGLTIKSDKEMEIAVPLSLVTIGGVISGRYGVAVALTNPLQADDKVGCELQMSSLKAYPAGSEMFQMVSDIKASNAEKCGHTITRADFNAQVNAPIALVNGAPIASRPILLRDATSKDDLEFATMVPADVLNKMNSFGIAVPFASRSWSASSPFMQVGLEVKRLGTPTTTILIVSATNYALNLCQEWTAQLTPSKQYPIGVVTNGLGAVCADTKSRNVVQLAVDSKDLKGVHRLMFVNNRGNYPPLTVDIPGDATAPLKPALDKSQKISLAQNDVKTVTFTGTNLAEITKVYFDKTELGIVQKDSKKIVVSIPAIVTAQPRVNAELLFQSEDNDPLIGC